MKNEKKPNKRRTRLIKAIRWESLGNTGNWKIGV